MGDRERGPADAFAQAGELIRGIHGSKPFNLAAVRDVADLAVKETYNAGGRVTVNEIWDIMRSRPGRTGWLGPTELDNNHCIPKDSCLRRLIELDLPGAEQPEIEFEMVAIQDEMPGCLIEKTRHQTSRGGVRRSFHDLEKAMMKADSQEYLTKQSLIDDLERVWIRYNDLYGEADGFDYMKVWNECLRFFDEQGLR